MDIGRLIGGLGSSLIGGIGSIISSSQQTKLAKELSQQQIDAQKDMNERNIAFQNATNDKMLNFQRAQNEAMRFDSNNAISIKKRDLQNAGYSTADPSFSGATTASLSSPTLTSPHVESEFPADAANLQQQAHTNLSNSLLSSSQLFADIALKRAQVRELDARATTAEKNNAWIDAIQQVNLDTSLQNLTLLGQTEKINEKELEKYTYDFKLLDNQVKLAFENVETAKLNNAKLSQTLNVEIQSVYATFDEIRQRIRESRSRVSLNSKQREVLESQKDKNRAESLFIGLQSDFQRLNNNFAKYGLNLNGSDIINTLGRLASSPNGKEVLPLALDFLIDSFKGLFDKISSSGDDDDKPNSKMPLGTAPLLPPLVL